MSSVFVLGSLNLDHVITVTTHPVPGETRMARSLHLFPGGKGANQAVAAARLGAEVRMLGLLGDDSSGRQMLAALTEEGVDTALIGTRGAVSGSAFLTVAENGENSILVVPGANGSMTPADTEPLATSITAGDLLVIQLEVPLAAAKAGAQAARDVGAQVILNAAPAMEVGELLTLVDVLVVNETEAAFYSRSRVTGVAEARRTARALRDTHGVDIIVTLGADGAVIADAHDVHHVAGIPVAVVDTTGAGDTFVGALATLLADGRPIVPAVEFAVRAAALACTALGAQNSMPTRADMSDPATAGRTDDTDPVVEEIA